MNKNAIVGQSGGPTAVINASLAGVIEATFNREINRIYGMQNGIRGFLEERIFELNGIFNNSLQIELLKRTPSSYLGSCRYKLPCVEQDEEIYEEIFSILPTLTNIT